MRKGTLVVILFVIVAALLYVALSEEAPEAPSAQGVYDVTLLSTSDTSGTEISETIEPSGHVIRWTLTDADLDVLESITLRMRVSNRNTGGADAAWSFNGGTTKVAQTAEGLYVVDRISFNTKWDCTASFTDVGSPTVSGDCDAFTANDFKTGLSDVLVLSFMANADALDDWTPSHASVVAIEVRVQDVLLSVHLVEQ
jgi:hypothetical protein